MIVPFFAVTRILFQTKCKQRNQLCHVMRKESVSQFHNTNFTELYNKFQRFSTTLPPFSKKYIWSKWHCHLTQVLKILKSNPVEVAKNCVEHLEFVVAQRIRRGQQMITLYSRLWDEKSLRQFFQKIRRALNRKGKQFIMGSSVLAFDWGRERISISELERHVDEMKICHVLRKKAATGEEVEGVSECRGPECSCPECDSFADVHCWEPFIKEEDLTLWKMEDKHHPGSGLYCYKIYGKYSDVTADDFLEVFLDTDNRIKWDVHAATLKVIESEARTNSDVIYWETKWPTLFSNRDYVFIRRHYKNESNKVIIIMNKSTEHPLFPPTSTKARVTEYWSYMVIKANSEFDKPGIEFSLTYFDNPGVSLPSSLSLWIAVQGLPEYLKNLRREALAIGENRKKTKEEEVKDIMKRKVDTPGSVDQDGCAHSPLSDLDIFYLFGTYMEKIKSSLWL